MERQIGEIFEYKGEWYQCLKSPDGSCKHCDMDFEKCPIPVNECTENGRSDKSYVIFKKLEKVGEPYIFSNMAIHNITMQRYKVFVKPIFTDNSIITTHNIVNETISIEIKQNKEDMEIHRVVMNIDDRDYLLDRLDAILHDTHCQQYKDEVCEALSKYIITRNTSDLKPFDLNSAKAGKPVCTRDGRKARIICFDAEGEHPIIALVTDGVQESPYNYTKEGYYHIEGVETMADLMMLSEKKGGWVNVYKFATVYVVGTLFDNEEDARKDRLNPDYIATIKIEWEE